VKTLKNYYDTNYPGTYDGLFNWSNDAEMVKKLVSDRANVYLVAANLRMAINNRYELGYDASQLSDKDLAWIGQRHNEPFKGTDGIYNKTWAENEIKLMLNAYRCGDDMLFFGHESSGVSAW